MMKLKKGVEGAPKDVADQFKAFKKVFTASIKAKLPEEEQKQMAKINKAVKDAYDTITKDQEKEVAKFIQTDKKRYEKERNEFNEKGFYTLSDGTRSIDVIAKKSKKAASDAESGDDKKANSTKKEGPKKMGRSGARC